MIEININKTKKISIKPGIPLIFALSQNGIFLPSACGGKGLCGMCRIKVISRLDNPFTPAEEKKLSLEDKNNGFRLGCQIIPDKNIEIEIPEELLTNIKDYSAVVSSIKDLTHDIKEIKFQFPDKQTINFNPGQYVQLEVPPYENVSLPIQRAYSIASTPRQRNSLELIIRSVENGLATSYIFKHLKVNDKLRIIGPFGDFFLRENQNDMICVAGGSGMSPLKSMIFHLAELNKIDRNIWYFFGAQSLKDLFYYEEFKSIEKKFDRFKFIPVLLKAEPEDNWTGEKGLVTEALEKYFKVVIDKKSLKEGYLCGSPGMIDAAIKVMSNNGMNLEKIYYDKFA